MKIFPISDLHFEFRDLNMENMIIDSLPKADVLVIAGDLISLRSYDSALVILKKISEKYQDTIYAFGNHEFYSSSPDDILNIKNKLENRFGNIHILDKSSVYINDIKFIGCTGWFKYNCFNRDNKYLNDFKKIKKFIPYLKQEYVAGMDFIYENTDDQTCIVTHHAPLDQSVSPKHKGSPLNAFYVMSGGYIIEKQCPMCWIHGHVHTINDYIFDKTHIISNAFGYPNEKTGFKNDFILDF